MWGGKTAEDVLHWGVLGVGGGCKRPRGARTRWTSWLCIRFKNSAARSSNMFARSPLVFFNARAHPSQTIRPTGRWRGRERTDMKRNIQQRANFTNKCILSVGIFTDKPQTIPKRHAESNLHSLLLSFSVEITHFDFLFYLHFPLLFPFYFINLSLGTMDNIWYSSITLTAALKMSLQHHHISPRASILPSTAPARASSSHFLFSSLPSSPFQLELGAEAPQLISFTVTREARDQTVLLLPLCLKDVSKWCNLVFWIFFFFWLSMSMQFVLTLQSTLRKGGRGNTIRIYQQIRNIDA